MTAKTSIVIPVYGAFEVTRDCLQSVLQYSDGINQVIVIDDVSPEGELADVLPKEIVKHPLIHIERNEKNLGFVASCNRGMELAGEADVILLNSDTVVTANWAVKLREAAYSRESVGTATALSNNATICSVPRFGIYNDLPAGYTIDEFAELVEAVSARQYIELPSCIGSCVFIKREVLSKLGGLDEESFGKGYGEENDFSCRAQSLGYVDIVDDATYIYHHGEQSFGEDKTDLCKQNTEILNQKHPHYFDKVSRFCNRNPMRNIALRILDGMVERELTKKPRRVLHVLQNGPHVERTGMLGGTELHVRDIIETDTSSFHWSLVPTKRCYYLSAHIGGSGGEGGKGVVREYVLDLRHISLKRLFDPELFDTVHLHHSRFYDHTELCSALSEHPNYAVSFHDFILGCPRFHLYTPFRKLCNYHECAQSCGYKQEYIDEYRTSAQKLFQNAKRMIHFSDSTRDLMQKIIPGEFAWEKIPHGIPDANAEDRVGLAQARSFPSAGESLRVAFIGNVPQHKGSLVAEKLLDVKTLDSGLKIEWHVIGKLFLETNGRVVDHGSYSREEIFEILKKVNPHINLILSICPETYCLTLDESWNAGIPVISTPLGAPAERMRQTGAGWVLPEVSFDAVMSCLQSIAASQDEYKRACNSLKNVELQTVRSEASRYAEQYEAMSENRVSCEAVALQKFLEPFSFALAPESGALGKVVGYCVNKTIYLLDSLHIRGHIQRTFNSVVPERLVRELKALR